jgi:hypothetical protein
MSYQSNYQPQEGLLHWLYRRTVFQVYTQQGYKIQYNLINSDYEKYNIYFIRLNPNIWI